mmetsp:Transcript_38398/g.62230  ORF Transcript_38398/g.62230 Transcript_38398/m.62230 type:complete len:300 (-) Transcript_38398:465-1364(-)
MEELYQSFSRTKRAQFISEVVHVALYDDGSDVFFFPAGVVICWGLKRSEERRLLADLKRFNVEEDSLQLEGVKDDDFRYVYFSRRPHPLEPQQGDTGPGGKAEKPDWIRIVRDEIVIPDCRSNDTGTVAGPGKWGDRTQDLLYKLSFSYALATSVKLDFFEDSIQKIIDNTRPLPVEMAQKGRITLGRKEIVSRIGQLFLDRSSVNLHSEILDTPAFFWEFPELEPVYISTLNYLNVRTRVDVLNKRLDVCKEMLFILNNEINHRHSSNLEWIVILLIVCEVLISIITEVLHQVFANSN